MSPLKFFFEVRKKRSSVIPENYSPEKFLPVPIFSPGQMRLENPGQLGYVMESSPLFSR